MNTKARITSILKAQSLDNSITGFQTFDLAKLEFKNSTGINEQEFNLPINLRLGHIAETVVSQLIKSSSNYNVLRENVQIIEEGKTIGEVDFIIKDEKTSELTHLELAYKFYLFDPNISEHIIDNWIGPNRNDSLKEKLQKLKEKQFPLLYQKASQSNFKNINTQEIKQALCLLASLFIPYGYKRNFSASYQKAIKGYYVNFETFKSFNHSEKLYHLPSKKEWGIDPSENEKWISFNHLKEDVITCIDEQQAPLCWQKEADSYLQFFIVWW